MASPSSDDSRWSLEGVDFMRRMIRLLFASISLLPTTLVGQSKASLTVDSSPATSMVSDRTPVQQLLALHNRAYTALRAEQERSKQPLCPKALSTIDMNQCAVQEFDSTEGNYQAEIKALSALIGGLRDLSRGSDSATPLDDAESTWHTYREQACNAFAGPVKNAGTIRPYLYETCLITLTRSHMRELGDLYAEVGMH
jgi:uncharacterized protein YecT (DUF1311 family)